MDFWIFGGINSNASMSTVSHLFREGIWYEGPQMPVGLKGMCAAELLDQYAVLIGGMDANGNNFVVNLQVLIV